jgi:RNA polymerase sigma-70 factor, ECF subfamily
MERFGCVWLFVGDHKYYDLPKEEEVFGGPVIFGTVRDPFTSFYQREAAYVARALRRCGVAHDELEDAQQEVFLVLHRRWRELDPSLSLRPWLYAVARRVSRNRRRACARRKTDPFDPSEAGRTAHRAVCPSPLPDDQLAVKEAIERLQRVLKRLPPERRAVYLLTVVDELTATEIATRVRCPRNTVSSQLRLARSEVRRHLERQLAVGSMPRKVGSAAPVTVPALEHLPPGARRAAG